MKNADALVDDECTNIPNALGSCRRKQNQHHSLAKCVWSSEVIIKFEAVVNLSAWLKQMSMYHMLKLM